mmetsp:Transcript_10171/g.30680  ORF Transcript_10171/g.30680 Transcript_10171/m.30680 type:complete len:93 (+) Transcript_10171:749-1027(+)|eukprot:366485-Chlamydomonas_euryale.AAC.9
MTKAAAEHAPTALSAAAAGREADAASVQEVVGLSAANELVADTSALSTGQPVMPISPSAAAPALTNLASMPNVQHCSETIPAAPGDTEGAPA